MSDAPSRAERPDVAIVTGAAGLLGAAVVEAFLATGARVLALDTVRPKLPATSWAGAVQAATVDIRDEAAVVAVMDQARTTWGPLRWLVHTAALTGRSGRLTSVSLVDADLDLWREMVDTNLTGALISARAFAPNTVGATDPQILIFGSIQGAVPTIGSGMYAVSKSALVGLVRQLAAELADDDIRVNMVSPGPIAADSEIAQLRSSGADVAPTLMRRFGRPEEVAASVVDLCSGFTYVTGAVLPVDGGEHLRARQPPPRKNPPVGGEGEGGA